MTSRQSHFRLGLFTLGAVILAVAGFLILGRGNWFRQTLTVETYFDQSISGLAVGAPVRHRGVDIGKVTRIAFASSKYEIPPSSTAPDPRHRSSMATRSLVVLAIVREAVKPLGGPGVEPADAAAAMVKDGLRLKLVTSLLGGGGYIDADFESDPTRSPPPNIPWTPTAVYIPSVPSGASRLVDSLDNIAGDIENAHPGDIIRHVDSLIMDMRRITQGVDTAALQSGVMATVADLRATIAHIDKILADPHIDSILTNASGAIDNIKTLTDPEKSNAARLLVDHRKSAKTLAELLDDPALKQTIANAGALTTDARKAIARVTELIAGQEQEIAEMIRSLKATAQNVEAITDDAKQNPARLIFGQPPPKGPGTN